MPHLLRVGVIGLGRRWRQQYRPALAALPDRFRLVGLYDQVRHRAAGEARRLGCRAAAGPGELLDAPDVDAVLLLDVQWFRLWPLEAAGRTNKAVFCCAGLEADAPHADRLVGQLRASGLPVMFELAPRAAPATARLRELLDGPLGPARLLLGDATRPAGRGTGAVLPGSTLVDWCADVLGAGPEQVAASASDAGRFASLALHFPGGRSAHLTRWAAPHARRSLRLRVIAERGWAVVTPPGRVSWTDASGRHLHTLPRGRPLGQVLLERFHRDVVEGRPPGPGLDEAERLLRWLQAAARSREEGRPVATAG